MDNENQISHQYRKNLGIWGGSQAVPRRRGEAPARSPLQKLSPRSQSPSSRPDWPPGARSPLPGSVHPGPGAGDPAPLQRATPGSQAGSNRPGGPQLRPTPSAPTQWPCPGTARLCLLVQGPSAPLPGWGRPCVPRGSPRPGRDCGWASKGCRLGRGVRTRFCTGAPWCPRRAPCGG